MAKASSRPSHTVGMHAAAPLLGESVFPLCKQERGDNGKGRQAMPGWHHPCCASSPKPCPEHQGHHNCILSGC